MGRCARVMTWKSLLTAAHTEQVTTHPPWVPQVYGDSAVSCFLGSSGSSKGTVPAEGMLLEQGVALWGSQLRGLRLCGYQAAAVFLPAGTWLPTRGEFIPP